MKKWCLSPFFLVLLWPAAAGAIRVGEPVVELTAVGDESRLVELLNVGGAPLFVAKTGSRMEGFVLDDDGRAGAPVFSAPTNPFNQSAGTVSSDRRSSSFLVTFTEIPPSRLFPWIRTRRHGTDGREPGTVHPIDSSGVIGEEPRIATDGAGNGMVVWRSFRGNRQIFALRGRAVDADGAPVAAEFEIAAPIAGAIAVLPSGADDGSFLAFWSTDSRVHAARIDAQGVREPPRVLADDVLRFFDVRVVMGRSDNELILAYFDFICDAGELCPSVSARRYDGASLDPLGDAFVLAAGGGRPSDFDVAARDDGDYTIAWSDHGSLEIRARDFRSDGTLLGPPVTVASGVANPVRAEAVGDRVLVAWTTVRVPRNESRTLVRAMIDAVECGNVVRDGAVSATDALRTLSAAVGAADCSPCVCDVGLPTGVDATDALRILRAAVGLVQTLDCPC